jgi:hypothetical protein
MGEKRNAYRILAGKSEGRGHLEDLRVNGKIILKLTFKATRRTWTGYMWLQAGTCGGLL